MNLTSDDQTTETDRLLRQIGSGDRSSLDVLLAAHRDYIRRLIDLRMDDQLRRRVDPSDVVQETQLVASQRIDDYLSSRSVPFRLWLRQTALERLSNLRQHHVQTLKRSVAQEIHLSDQSAMLLAKSTPKARPSRILRQEETVQQIRKVIAEMKDNDREVLVMRHFEELTNREISELLGVDLDTVRKRYGRALLRLRESLIAKGLFDSK